MAQYYCASRGFPARPLQSYCGRCVIGWAASRPEARLTADEQTPVHDNPMGTDGFEFVEYTAPDPEALGRLFESHGVPRRGPPSLQERDCSTARATSISSSMREPDSFGASLRAGARAVSACAMAFRVKDAAAAFKRAVALGARPVPRQDRPHGAQHPGHRGHRRQPHLSRGPLWRARARSTMSTSSPHRGRARAPAEPGGPGLTYIDHLTHNVHRGRMDNWADFYEQPVRLPRDPLLRHRGHADRPQSRAP